MSTFRERWRTRGPVAFAISLSLVALYVVLYFRGEWIRPIAVAMGLRSEWLLYGALYSIAMAGGAVYYLRRHGNSRYNRVRIAVNLAVQVILAFSLPLVMPWLGGREAYLSYFWPLSWYDLHPGTLRSMPLWLALYAVVGALVAAPVLAIFFGKRWYCSWVCGCGGLANTFGDPFRHLTSTSTRSWRFEKWSVHIVLALAVVSTALLFVDELGHGGGTFHALVASERWWSLKKLYGLVVGAILAGVVGTGLYPLLGPRVWCRNFCPMAALLGFFHRVGNRFRVRVKPDMCISCGNCTTYCEMGIDVRSYAQSNQSFTRASCVGCGMCAHVCPRGVLRVESTSPAQKDKARTRLPIADF
ncbi:MAG: 4Fe-4S binding protein [Sandaracinaceae bacterium]|nr:4Fe-4S binding protein [Sandaracinaceae bacterium]